MTTEYLIKNAAEIFHTLRWKDVVVCPYCGSIHIKDYGDYHYKCNSCKNRFNDKTNTLMHNSKLSVSIWLLVIYEMTTNHFISSTLLSKKLGINQKSAWLLMTKIRYAMSQDDILLKGIVSIDEMYVGGSLSNFHYSRKWKLLRDGHYIKGDEKRYSKNALFALNSDLKQPVIGMTDGDKVILKTTPNPIKREYIIDIYNKHAKGTIVVADESKLYNDWNGEIHLNNHHNNQYVNNGFTSNPIENKFSWFKRDFQTLTHCKYHQLYLNEYCFKYNHRNLDTLDVLRDIITEGKYITYKEIKQQNVCKHSLSSEFNQLLNSGVVSYIKEGHFIWGK